MGSLVGMTVRGFLDELGSDSPAPGGGSVAALAAAQAAALISMVARLTLGKKQDGTRERMAAALQEAEALGRELAELCDRDTEAFLEVMSAYRLPRDQANRSAAIQAALRQAASVPLEVMRRAVRLLPLARFAVEEGLKSARTDATVGAIMAHAALQGAALNTLVNLGALTDRGFAGEVAKEVKELRSQGEEVYQLVTSSVFAGLEQA